MTDSIRFADQRDIDSVAAVEKQSGGSWDRLIFVSELKNSFSKTLVYENENNIAGFAVIWIIEDEIQLNRICVLPEFRNTGIGKSLINFIRDYYPGKKIFLEVAEKNIPAISLYDSAGFKKTGFRKDYYPDDNAVLMDLN